MGEKDLARADFEKCLELAHDPWEIQQAQQALEELGA